MAENQVQSEKKMTSLNVSSETRDAIKDISTSLGLSQADTVARLVDGYHPNATPGVKAALDASAVLDEAVERVKRIIVGADRYMVREGIDGIRSVAIVPDQPTRPGGDGLARGRDQRVHMRPGSPEPAHAAVGLRSVKPADDRANAGAESVEHHPHSPLLATVTHCGW